MKIPVEFVYFIAEAGHVDLKDVGSKGFNLFKLRNYFNVPDFAVLVTRAFQESFSRGKLPALFEKEIENVLKFFFRSGAVAVRSSATSEDTETASFAGMYNTSLNIKSVEEGIAAVIKTWRSLDSERARNYRKKMRCERGQMAVKIQNQPDPE